VILFFILFIMKTVLKWNKMWAYQILFNLWQIFVKICLFLLFFHKKLQIIEATIQKIWFRFWSDTDTEQIHIQILIQKFQGKDWIANSEVCLYRRPSLFTDFLSAVSLIRGPEKYTKIHYSLSFPRLFTIIWRNLALK